MQTVADTGAVTDLPCGQPEHRLCNSCLLETLRRFHACPWCRLPWGQRGANVPRTPTTPPPLERVLRRMTEQFDVAEDNLENTMVLALVRRYATTTGRRPRFTRVPWDDTDKRRRSSRRPRRRSAGNTTAGV